MANPICMACGGPLDGEGHIDIGEVGEQRAFSCPRLMGSNWSVWNDGSGSVLVVSAEAVASGTVGTDLSADAYRGDTFLEADHDTLRLDGRAILKSAERVFRVFEEDADRAMRRSEERSIPPAHLLFAVRELRRRFRAHAIGGRGPRGEK